MIEFTIIDFSLLLLHYFTNAKYMLKVRKRAENLNFLSNSFVLFRQFFYSRDQFMALLRVNEMTIDI